MSNFGDFMIGEATELKQEIYKLRAERNRLQSDLTQEQERERKLCDMLARYMDSHVCCAGECGLTNEAGEMLKPYLAECAAHLKSNTEGQ